MMRIAEKVLTQVIFILYGYNFYYLIRKQKKKKNLPDLSYKVCENSS